ncbi:MAG: MFS transporter [Acidimicrobiales bacterium]
MTRARRPLAGLLTAVGISTLGTRMTFLAVPWLVLTTTGSAALTGIVAFAEMAPYVGVQALGGPLIDRVGAKRTSVVTDLIAGAALGAVPVLLHLGLLSIPALGGLVALGGAVRGAGDAARDVLVPGASEIAGTTLERSSGLYDGVNRLAGLAGLPAAGALVSLMSAGNVLALDAASFIVSAVLVFAAVPVAAQPTRAPATTEERESYVTSLREGLRYLRSDRLLLGIAVMILVTNFVDQAGGAVLFPVWAHRIMHSPADLGLLGGVFSLGAVGGNALTSWIGSRMPRRSTYGVGFLVAGAPRFLAVAFLSALGPVLGIAFVSGAGAGGINPILGAVEYERVPRHLQARVLGTVGALAWAGIPFGSLAAGGAVSAFGLRASLVLAACVYGVTTLAPFVFPSWRAMNRRPEGEPGIGDRVGGESGAQAASSPAPAVGAQAAPDPASLSS